MAVALEYLEPDIVSLLIIASFLLALNVGNYIADRVLSCGLIAQLLIGIAWGTPGINLLDEPAETLITSLGYVGLILLVFEGGLSTNIHELRKNLFLSAAIAFIGIIIPIAFSFILARLADATPLQSFASGAALCSTSLGTTFTVLKASGLAQTRLGAVLTSAAMLDDVVGLVMVQIISNLNGAFEPASVIRPVGVSIAFAVLTVSFCFSTKYCAKGISKTKFLSQTIEYQHSAFVFQTLFLLGMVVAASYAGTSNLFAAYLAGISVSWWYTDDVVQDSIQNPNTSPGRERDTACVDAISQPATAHPQQEALAGPDKVLLMYETYYMQVVERLLKPFFFASIGFAIPITRMFEAPVIWRGFIYGLLMTIAKMFTGLWLVRIDFLTFSRLRYFVGCVRRAVQRTTTEKSSGSTSGIELSCVATNNAQSKDDNPGQIARQGAHKPINARSQLRVTATSSDDDQAKTNKPTQPISLYPASILGMAMVARGEIGFLIATTAQSSGIFKQGNSQVLYLTVIWAVVMCTVVGPVSTGLLVRRVRRFQKHERAGGASERSDPLGSWGVL